MKYLIVNSDDFGLCPSVNKGIIECINIGSVTDFSFIINPDYFGESLELLKNNNIKSCGIHLNLLGLKSPVTLNSSFVNNGYYPKFSDLLKLLIRNRINILDIEKEIHYQIQVLLDNGIEITHIDTHRNIHILNSIFSVINRASDKYSLKVPIRIPYENRIDIVKNTLNNSVRIAILNMGSSFLMWQNKISPQIHAIGGNFFNNTNPQDVFNFILQKIRVSKYLHFEMAVHPGYNSEELGSIDTYTTQRETELNFLKCVKLPIDIELKSFKQIQY
jgi:chitin disaccharide deacetylase